MLCDRLADMATKIEAACLLTRKAARMKDAGERSDLEAGMAKLLASETGKEVVEERFASTVATATRRSTRSSGSTATLRCC